MSEGMKSTDLSQYDNSWYQPGRGALLRFLWYLTNLLVIMNRMNPFSGIRVFFLRLYGAKIGRGVVIKPGVNIKYPWKLKIGHYSWIGEDVWIDNLDEVSIGSNACISQGAMLLCGNHDYKKVSFDLITGPISLEDGAWIGARAIVGPGAYIGKHTVLAAGSVSSAKLEAGKIYRGNPAVIVRDRVIE